MLKFVFMFDFLNSDIPDEMKTFYKRLLIFNASIYSYETHSFKILHISKTRASNIVTSTLTNNGA